jgi:16S rRNA (uracil1498-N3)-methyltransferase
MARRLFYAQEWKAGRAYLKGETAEHVRRVLRAERGQIYELSDGERVWLGRIEGFAKETVEFALLEELAVARAPVPVHLLAALIKFDHFEWMIEKATELGVERITPVAALRSERGLAAAAEKRRTRWERIAREAGQQSRRVRPPQLDPVASLGEALRVPAASRLFLDEEPGAEPVLRALESVDGGVALVCGPEGGWDAREREEAMSEGWRRVSLGPMVLRAETAAVAAVAVAVSAWALRSAGECSRRA